MELSRRGVYFVEFNPWPVHVGFVVDNVALGQAFLRVLRLFPVSIISHSECVTIYFVHSEDRLLQSQKIKGKEVRGSSLWLQSDKCNFVI
jgi:hypothetical protein